MTMDTAAGGLPTEEINARGSGFAPQGFSSSIEPPASVDDYNRIMLQYTQRQLAAFTNNGSLGERRNSGTSGSSGRSVRSSASSVSNMARTGNGPMPLHSASASRSPDNTRA